MESQKEVIKEIKTRLKKAYGWSDERIETFWRSSSVLFDGKSPDDMCKDPRDFRRMKILFRFSTIPESWHKVSNTPEKVSNTRKMV